MKSVLFLILPLVLAACGADGPPIAPSVAAQQGLSVDGKAEAGVAGGS
jgi:hypothetical protein